MQDRPALWVVHFLLPKAYEPKSRDARRVLDLASTCQGAFGPRAASKNKVKDGCRANVRDLEVFVFCLRLLIG